MADILQIYPETSDYTALAVFDLGGTNDPREGSASRELGYPHAASGF
ncbi:hypothetical protein SNOG_13562 [Parastagonospora nodorum SN15]|uniref:Uncharacterized protein n=1 Tax=Phaeosphaeria nodorum (strain SN15 / ATCC MYA-4574 / FGSC 10173) TaxID=321614 RepID=Q0U3V2_PHANO|nr:hypothetical protein SNOG_13562 [Parastagonospora nodorum SN15]EAT79009.1 hypothetical protein SNOG_13562 [Parastagonospora nodorum SN15]